MSLNMWFTNGNAIGQPLLGASYAKTSRTPFTYWCNTNRGMRVSHKSGVSGHHGISGLKMGGPLLCKGFVALCMTAVYMDVACYKRCVVLVGSYASTNR